MSKRSDLRVQTGRRLARWARGPAPIDTRRPRSAAPESGVDPLPLLSLGEPRRRAPRWAAARTAAEARSLRRMLQTSDSESARRIAELQQELERTRELLALAEASSPFAPSGDLTPLPSAYRGVQGLSADAPLAVLKRMLLHEVYLENVELRQERRGA